MNFCMRFNGSSIATNSRVQHTSCWGVQCDLMMKKFLKNLFTARKFSTYTRISDLWGTKVTNNPHVHAIRVHKLIIKCFLWSTVPKMPYERFSLNDLRSFHCYTEPEDKKTIQVSWDARLCLFFCAILSAKKIKIPTKLSIDHLARL